MASSLFFIFLPILSLAIKLNQYQPSRLFNLKAWIEVITHFELSNWLLVLFSFSIGFLIYRVSKFSLILVSSFFCLILLLNIFLLKKIVLWAIILPLVFWFSPFRRPYLNRALRWWEQLPRFWIKEDQSELYINQKKAKIKNMSLSGVLVEPLEDRAEIMAYPLEHIVTIKFSEIEIAARLKRKTESEIGCEYINLSNSLKRKIKLFLRQHHEERIR